MADDLQSDISLWNHKRIGEFLSSPSLSTLSFLETTMALKYAHGKKEEERRRQMRNRQKNGAKTLPLLLLKEKGTLVMEGHADQRRKNSGARNSLSLSHLMQMRHALTDETYLARRNSS